MKQISRVLAAVDEGGETSDQIAAMTGLPLPHVSAYLTDLARDGLIRLVRHEGRRYPGTSRGSHVYAPAK
jgi:DNA-binding IclR family transcriptional regulator